MSAEHSEPEERKLADDAWLDEALSQSFPASDPLPVFHGDTTPPEPAEERDLHV